jgi:nucleotide-binding universal stress UspA family protein
MTPRYAHIAIATDFSDHSERAIAIGADLAQRSGADVTLLHVFDPSPYMLLLEPRSPEEAEQVMGDAARKELERLAKEYLGGVERVRAIALHHPSAAAGICDYVGKHDIELVVVGTQGRTGLARVLMGSCATRLLRHAPSDILVVRGDTTSWEDRHIVAPTDLSENGSAAVDAAAQLHEAFGGKLSLLHVLDETIPVPSTEGFGLADTTSVAKRLKKELDEIRGQHFGDDDTVSSHVLVGETPAPGICRWAEEHAAQLLVVATHGRTGLSAMLIGSVAEQVVQHAPCPVLTVRGKKAEKAD